MPLLMAVLTLLDSDAAMPDRLAGTLLEMTVESSLADLFWAWSECSAVQPRPLEITIDLTPMKSSMVCWVSLTRASVGGVSDTPSLKVRSGCAFATLTPALMAWRSTSDCLMTFCASTGLALMASSSELTFVSMWLIASRIAPSFLSTRGTA